MRTIKETLFVTESEIESCFDFSVGKLLPYEVYYFVDGIADIGLFLDKFDRDIQQNSIVPAVVSCHMLNSLFLKAAIKFAG